MWFAFKFYLWQRSYKKICTSFVALWVVICFQILSLTTFLQVDAINCKSDIVVICFQILSLTTFLQVLSNLLKKSIVVICFQILSLTTFLQVLHSFLSNSNRCDLLSNFIFDNVLTRRKQFSFIGGEVVICFQILSLTTFLQALQNLYFSSLVVICFQILSLTTFLQAFPALPTTPYWLWFAFKFYLWQRSYKL